MTNIPNTPNLKTLTKRFLEIARVAAETNVPTKAFIQHSLQGFELSMDENFIIHVLIGDEELATIYYKIILKYNVKANILEHFLDILPLEVGYSYNFSI